MDLNDLDRRGGEWLRGGGTHFETVISSRIRLARNLASFPFINRLAPEEQRVIVDRVRPALESLGLWRQTYFVDVEQADDLLGSFLVERHLISRELQNGRGPRGVVFGPDESLSVMVNEEDHLRIQTLRASLALDEAFQAARAVDLALEQTVEYAVHETYGYLTACPTNVGTGLRASVMLHLPAMVQMKQIEKLFHAASQSGLTVRGFYGEGTMASGDLYQVSNQVTLGRTEAQILGGLKKMLPWILEYERRCRGELLSDRRRLKQEDRCHRALSTLRSARLLSTEEAMQLLSLARFGVVSGILAGPDLEQINELFVLVQPAHVQKVHGASLEASDRDAARAAFVRTTLN